MTPASTDALTGMANIYMRGDRYTEAEEILRKLVALDPGTPGPTWTWAGCWPLTARTNLPSRQLESP